MRFLPSTSFFLSLCLHAGVIALALFWTQSAPPLVDLNAPVIDIGIYTIGSPGAAPSRTASAPKPPSAPAALPEPPRARPETAKPPQDTVKPEPAPEKPEPRPTPPPPAKPEAEPTPIPQPEDKPKPEPAKPEPVKPEPAKPAPKPTPSKDVLGSALRDLKREPDSKSVDRALGELRNSGGEDQTGTGPGGQGGDGIGLIGSYMQSLVSRIKPNWEYAGRADRRNPTAVVSIDIAKDGSILNAVIVTSSGDPAFDGSVLKAVRDTVRVEPPPTPDLMKVSVPFAYEAIRR